MDQPIDIYSLFAGEGPTQQERAAALAAQLRKQRGAGQLALLTGDKVLGGYGQAQLGQADALERMLGGAGQQAAGHRNALALQGNQQAFQDAQGERERGWKTGQADAERTFHGREHALQRALQRELEGMQSQRALDVANIKNKGDTAKNVTEWRKEMNGLPEMKQFKEVSVAFQKVRGAAESANAAGDMSLIFGYMKLLDPGSSVREGEYANAQNAGGIPELVSNLYNKAKDGQFLTPQQRANFIAEAEKLYQVHANQVAPIFEQYRGYAERAGADPNDVAAGAGKPRGRQVQGPDGKTYEEGPDGQMVEVK